MENKSNELYYEYKDKEGKINKMKLPEGNYFEIDIVKAAGPCVSKYIGNLFNSKKYKKWQLYKFASIISNHPEGDKVDWFNTFYLIEKEMYRQHFDSMNRMQRENYFCNELIELQCKIQKIKLK